MRRRGMGRRAECRMMMKVKMAVARAPSARGCNQVTGHRGWVDGD